MRFGLCCLFNQEKISFRTTTAKADPSDVPACRLGRTMTVAVEAKAKELAVVSLMTELKSRGSQ